jgi:hypothetical protein
MAKEQSIKGEKGFQSYPKELIRSTRVSLRVTPSEKELLNKYVDLNNTTIAELIRNRLKDVLTPLK